MNFDYSQRLQMTLLSGTIRIAVEYVILLIKVIRIQTVDQVAHDIDSIAKKIIQVLIS